MAYILNIVYQLAKNVEKCQNQTCLQMFSFVKTTKTHYLKMEAMSGSKNMRFPFT